MNVPIEEFLYFRPNSVGKVYGLRDKFVDLLNSNQVIVEGVEVFSCRSADRGTFDTSSIHPPRYLLEPKNNNIIALENHTRMDLLYRQ